MVTWSAERVFFGKAIFQSKKWSFWERERKKKSVLFWQKWDKEHEREKVTLISLTKYSLKERERVRVCMFEKERECASVCCVCVCVCVLRKREYMGLWPVGQDKSIFLLRSSSGNKFNFLLSLAQCFSFSTGLALR